ncbi:thioredoxin [Streptomyces sp. NPDC059402]|uniref:thioredoxin n=1 Tax=unclassified Streptomyces TaxID=2593676 RepID=UPI00367956A3
MRPAPFPCTGAAVALKAVTDASFAEDVLGSSKPVLVDFWADWCAPCRQVAPHLEAIAAEFGDKVEVVKLNIDENADTTRNFQVLSVPTLILFKDGEPVKSIVGSRPKADLLKALSDFLYA